jgi:hypothetical protein
MIMRLLEKTDQEMELGGVCIYLRSSINYIIRQVDLISSELEAVCVEIIKPHSQPFLVTTIYRPPNASSEFFDHFEKLCKATTSYPGSFHYAPRWRKDPGPGWSRVSQILGDNKIFT